MVDILTKTNLKLGNPDAFKKLFRILYPRLKGYCNLFIHNKNEIEDIIQESFITLWEKREEIKTEKSVESFVFVIVRNRCLNVLKKQKLREDDIKLDNLNFSELQLDIKDDVKLQEWYENETVVTGVRQIVISWGTAEINNDTFTASVKLHAGESLNMAGIKFWHKATLIEPLNSAPKAGTVNDFSARSFKYRLHSADGTTHDWTVNIID